MLRFSAHLTQLFTEVPFAKRFEAAARNGFAACEFRSPYEFALDEIRGWLRASGLPNILFNAPAGDWARGERGIAALPGREHEFRSGIAMAMRYADALGTPMLHVMAGITGSALEEATCHRAFIGNLRFGARELAKSGRTLLIEAINARDLPGYFLTTQEQAHRIREEVAEPNLLIQMDCYHAEMMGEPVEETIKRFLPVIGHIQVAGAPGRHEPDTGALDYQSVFLLLENLKYGRFIGCEYVPSSETEAGLDWMKRSH